VVTWWHAAPPERLATDPLAVIADRRITDSSISEDPVEALVTRAKDYAPGDTDLAWTRTTTWRSTLTMTLDSVAGRRGEPVRVRGGRVEGARGNATAELLAGWLSSRCGTSFDVAKAERSPGPSGVDAVVLQLDENEEIRVQGDRRGGATISQPFRPDTTVALPDRPLGDLLGEELRRLDPDEPYQEALEAATGVGGLADRPPVREHIWFDPADPSSGTRPGTARPASPPRGHTRPGTAGRKRTGAAKAAPTVPADSEGADEVAEHGEHDSEGHGSEKMAR
jgi:glucose-6-phosphate dehydrogenase assembly protein OpcA